MSFNYKVFIKWALVTLFFLGLLIIYTIFDPTESGIFPPCPFLELTGLKCPGCGSQRAIHHLLHFDLVAAFQENMLLVISIPYIITGAVFDLIKSPSTRLLIWRKRLFGIKAIFIVLGLIILFSILRNIFEF